MADILVDRQIIQRTLNIIPGGGGGTPLQKANRDVPLDGGAFSRPK